MYSFFESKYSQPGVGGVGGNCTPAQQRHPRYAAADSGSDRDCRIGNVGTAQTKCPYTTGGDDRGIGGFWYRHCWDEYPVLVVSCNTVGGESIERNSQHLNT